MVHFIDGFEGFVAGQVGRVLRASDDFGAGEDARTACQPVRQQTFPDQCALARTAHAGDQHQPAQRKIHVRFLRLFTAAPRSVSHSLVAADVERGSTFPGSGLSRLTSAATETGRRVAARRKLLLRPQALAGDRLGMLCQFRQRSARHDLPAMHARTRPQINDVIRPAHRVLVVLHDDHRVAARPEFLQNVEQLLVVAGVQADGRFVQYVKHAAEIRAELRGQPDALGFAAGKRRHGATELQVAETDFVEELQSLADFGKNVAGDFARRAR